MNYKSQIGYIMDLLEVSGRDLSIAINVDRTLVSKWKNNARPILSTNPHFKFLIVALIFFNSQRKDSTLERFFGQVYPNEDKNEPEYLEVCLRLWLIGKNLGNFNNLNDWRISKAALYATSIEVYQGNFGKRQAVLDFFDYALTLPAGQELFISDVESNDWLNEDKEYYELYFQKYIAIIKKGHNITVIHNLSVYDANPLKIQIERLKAYYTGQITSYYCDRQGPSNIEPSLFIIHRHMSLISMCTDGHVNNRYVAVYRDPFSVQNMVSMFIERVKNATKMVSTFSSQGSNFKGFIDELLKSMGNTNTYYTAPQIPLVVFSKEILEKVLKANNVPEPYIQFVEWVRQQNQSLFLKHIKTHDVELILSASKVKESLLSESTIMQELSNVCKIPIRVDQDLLIELFEMTDHLSQVHSNFNVHVVSFETMLILEEVVLWLFEDHILYTLLLGEGHHFVVSEAPVVLEAAINYLQNLLMENEDKPKLMDYVTMK